MKVKKFLEQQAEQDRQAILSESDANFMRETKAKINANSPPATRRPSRIKYWIIGATATLASIIVLVCVLVFYPFTQTDFTYYENNFLPPCDSTLQAMDEDMKKFTFDIDETLYSTRVRVITDGVSGDVIMYQVEIERNDSLVKLSFVAVCNENYQYRGMQITDKFTTEKLPLYDIHYSSHILPNPDLGVDTFNAQAQIQRGKEYIYITDYYEMMIGDQPRFFDIIQSIIQ